MNLLDAMRYLVALEQHRHFGRAASACHITQPALSNALRALERELGVAIVRRGRSYAGLTGEGERVLASANRLLHEHEMLRQDLHSSADAPRGTLAIGAVPTTIPVAARFAATLQARHPGIVPVVRSLSSHEIETGLASLSLDIGLGYTDRGTRFQAIPQYVEQYFLLRRVPSAGAASVRRGEVVGWREAAAMPLCLLTPDMHNRSIIDAAFRDGTGGEVRAAIETNSIVTVVLSVLHGEVCAVLPGALLALARGYPGLEALPLREPEVRTSIGFMVVAGDRVSRALQAALALAGDAEWLRLAATQGDLPAV